MAIAFPFQEPMCQSLVSVGGGGFVNRRWQNTASFARDAFLEGEADDRDIEGGGGLNS